MNERSLVEHPDYPGLFLDPGMVYIPTGDAVKDAAFKSMMADEFMVIPQKIVVGGAGDE